MLRFNALLLLWLGLVVSCAPSGPDEAVPAVVLQNNAQAVATSLAAPTVTVIETWSGGGPSTQTKCLSPSSCGTASYSYLCPGNKNSSSFKQTLEASQFTIPDGASVRKVIATVNGKSIYTGNTAPPSIDREVTLKVNGVSFGKVDSTIQACGTGAEDRSCDPNPSPLLSKEVGVDNFAWRTGATLNEIELIPNTDYYCISNVKLTLELNQGTVGATPNPLDFAKRRLNSNNFEDVTIKNVGTAPLTVTRLAISGAPAGTFTFVGIDPEEDFTLATTGTASEKKVQIRFTPPTADSFTGQLTITSNASNPTETVVLTGQGVESAVTLNTQLLDFQTQRVGKVKTMPVTVTNVTPTPVTLSDFLVTSASGDYAFVALTPSGTTTLTLAGAGLSGSSQNLEVAFTPSSEDLGNTGRLTFKSTEPDLNVSSFPVDFVGKGIAPKIEVTSADGFDFGDRRAMVATTKTVKVKNTGSMPVNLTGATMENHPEFSIDPPFNGSVNLPAGTGETTLTVKFRPTDSTASLTSPLRLQTSDTGEYASFNPQSFTGRGVRPNLVVTATDGFDFGDQRATEPAYKTVTVRNTGTMDMVLTGASMVTNTAFKLDLPLTAAVPLPAGTGSTTLTVKFLTADETTSLTDNLRLTTSDTVEYGSVNYLFTGKGVKPNLVVTPQGGSPDFGEWRINTPTTKTVVVSNTGSGPITLTGASMGTGAEFTLAPPYTGNTVLAARTGSTTLTVRFQPSSEKPFSDTLTLTTSDTSYPSVPLVFTGTGINPILTPIATTLTFDPQQMGVASTPKKVTLSNPYTGTLQIRNIATTGPFTVSPKPSLDLNGPTSQDLSVTFTPTATGTNTGTLTFTTNDPNNPSVTVNLEGTGQRTITVFPSTLEFNSVAKGAYLEKTFTLTNNSQSTISISRLDFGSTQYSSTFSTPTDLTPGNPLTVTVRFTPRVRGDDNVDVTVVSNATNTPKVALRGKGLAAVIRLAVNGTEVSDLRFGYVALQERATTTVQLSNVGDAKLQLNTFNINSAESPSPFSYLAPSVTELEPNASPLQVHVSYQPTKSGATNATLQITSNAFNSPVELLLTGTGTSAEISVDTVTKITFPNQKVGTESATRPLVINNPGKAPLKVTNITPPPHFAIESRTYPFEIPGESSTALQVAFAPTAAGLKDDFVTINSNASNTPSAKVPVGGRAIDGFPACEGSCIVTFADMDVGAPVSQKLNIGIKNLPTDNTTTLKLLRATVSTASGDNPFTISEIPVEIDIPSGGVPEYLTVGFLPAVRGTYKGTAIIETDSATTPTLTFQLSGRGKGPQAQATSSVEFEDANVGTSSTYDLSVTNIGENPLVISRIRFEEKTASTGMAPLAEEMALDFSTTLGTAGLTVNPGDTGIVPLKFSPRATGLREARAVIVAAYAAPVSVNLKGLGTSPFLEATPFPTLEINGVLLGSVSPPATVDIKNTGTGPVTIKSVELSPASASEVFEISPQPLTPGPEGTVGIIGPRDTMPIYVTFKPTAAIPSAYARLLVKSVDPRVPVVVVQLQGDGVSQPIEVQSELLFGAQLINSPTPATRALKLSNRINSDINVRDLKIIGTGCSQFRTDKTQFVVKKLSDELLNVYFSPLAQGVVSCKLQLSFTGFPDAEVAVSGEGIPAVLAVDPPSVDFGDVRVKDPKQIKQILLKNLSSDPITLAEPIIQATGPRFTLVPASLKDVVIGEGASLALTIEYEPKEATYSETHLGFGTSTPLTTQRISVPVKGNATTRILNVDQAGLDFGNVDANDPAPSKTITITNNSSLSQPVVVELHEGKSVFALDTNGMPGNIPSHGSATFSVSFDPEEPGDVADEIWIRVQGVSEPEVKIPVKGKGLAYKARGGGCSSSSGTELGSASTLILLALMGLRSRRRARE